MKGRKIKITAILILTLGLLGSLLVAASIVSGVIALTQLSLMGSFHVICWPLFNMEEIRFLMVALLLFGIWCGILYSDRLPAWAIAVPVAAWIVTGTRFFYENLWLSWT